METQKNSLHLNPKSSIIYSPLISQMKMYSTNLTDSSESTLERMYSSKRALNLNNNTPTTVEPKKENMLQTMFNSLTSIFVDQLVKVPTSIINNFSNVNNTLSVTIVPNEGIISHEFFKTLNGHKDNSFDNMYIQLIQKKEPTVDFVDTIKLKNKIHITKDECLKCINDSKFSTLDDFDLCLDTEPMFLCEKAFVETEIIMNQTLKTGESKSFDNKEDKKDKIIFKDNIISDEEIIFKDKLISSNNRQNFESSLNELPMEKNSSSSNYFSNIWHKVVNGVSDHFRSFSPAMEACTKKHQTTKTRRKAFCVSNGRGRGRGKSQLRRNGVSQTRHRKERSKHDLCSDIQEDFDAWEEFEAYTVPLSCLDEENLDHTIVNQGPSYSLSFELIDIKPKKTKQMKNVFVKSESFSMKVKYVPECSLEEREANCTIDGTAFRSRLISEVSVDSEDSYIVFETESDSVSDDFICFDDNEMSDSESETESETEDETLRHKVRFNLNPTIHKMVKWDFAYRSARLGPWEEMARDRERFKHRITCIGRILEPVLNSNFRTEIWKNRFAALK